MGYEQYIGIPFLDHGRSRAGLDCWGLVVLVYKEQLGILLPDLGSFYSNADIRREVQGAVQDTVEKSWNRDVTGYPRRLYDVIVFKRGGIETHVGLWVKEDTMLHVERNICVALERYDTARWKNKFSRVIRHVDLLGV